MERVNLEKIKKSVERENQRAKKLGKTIFSGREDLILEKTLAIKLRKARNKMPKNVSAVELLKE